MRNIQINKQQVKNIIVMNFFNKIAQKTSEISQKIKYINHKPQVLKVTDQIYVCPYPNNVQQLKTACKQLSGQKAAIWNLSQYTYSKQLRQKFQLQVTYEYYSSLPLTISIIEAKKLELYLSEDKGNIAFVHCQQNKSRSIIFLASYLYLGGKVQDVASALAEVNSKLGIKTDETVYSTQHSILRNIANYNKDPSCINKQQLKLVKVIINEAPQLDFIDLTLDDPLPIIIEIRRKDQVIYKKLTKQFGQGQITHFDLKNEKIILSDDCLFRFKYVYEKKIYPILRINLNTNFIFNNFTRVQMNQIDICKSAKVKMPIFADFLFEPVKGSQSELSKLHTQIKKLDSQIIQQKKTKKSPEKEIKTQADTKNESKAQKPQSPKLNVVTKAEVAHEQQFDIHDEQEDVTEESINKKLDSMAMKKADVTEFIQEAANEQEQFQQKQQEKLKKLKKEETQNKLEKEKKLEVKGSLQKSLQPTEGSISGVKNQTTPGQHQGDDLDMDDYLSKLQQQAENH